jgi:F-type H+-transporting ATPase subunit delta
VATAAARRYARAVFELAQQSGDVEAWRRRIGEVRELFSDPEIAAVLSNPTISSEQRQSLIVTTGRFDSETANLAKLLVEAGRVHEVGAIEEEFERLADEAAGRVRATVTTAVELSGAELDRITRELSKRLGKDVRVTAVIDPHVIGGAKFQYGDRVVDATVATRLQQLRRRLAAS